MLIYPTKPSVLLITISIIPIFSLTTTKNSTIPFSSSNQVLISGFTRFNSAPFFLHQTLAGFARDCAAPHVPPTSMFLPHYPGQVGYPTTSPSNHPTSNSKKRAWPKNFPSLRPATKRVCSGAFPRLGTCNYQNESIGMVPVSKKQRRCWSGSGLICKTED